ncbi:MAG: archaellum operon transcriptional activator EarA family protein [bacterium]|nr:archaellum operon transcriptional activator EarA family protein [bacterium]
MYRKMSESAVILAYISEVSASNGASIDERKLTEFMRQLGLNKGLIDFELISLVERGLIKKTRSQGRKVYKLTRKGNQYSKSVIIVN